MLLQTKAQGQQRDHTGAVLNHTVVNSSSYTYNIRGWLKGINWGGYGATSGGTMPLTDIEANKWFAMDLSYDWGFSTNQYNGNISGQRWATVGSGTERAYGYGYDGANRIMFADFNQQFGNSTTPNWSKSESNTSGFNIDFTVKMGDGINYTTAYDENGNILKMQQYGLKGSNSALIDDLTYKYQPYSNKLQNVKDDVNDPSTKLGDFRSSAGYMQTLNDNKTEAAIDYTYDNNGNLLQDLNKNIYNTNGNGITYNHLNLPNTITVKNDDGTDKGTIQYIYDAAGNKLQKIVTETGKANSTTTDYINGFVYENNTLQFFAQEEGRIRRTYNAATQKYDYVYDYFVKDHLGNTRMVLTDEQKEDTYAATNEDKFHATEQQLFIGGERVNKPVGFDNQSDNQVVNKIGIVRKVVPASGIPISFPPRNTYIQYQQKVGQGIVLKVMAGDKITANVFGWHSTGYSNQLPLSPPKPYANVYKPIETLILQLLSNGIAQVGGKSVDELSVDDGSSNPLLSAISAFVNPQKALETPQIGKGYLNWLMVDETTLKYVANNSGFVSLPETMNNGKELLQTPMNANSNDGSITIQQNGYIYIFTSNTSTTEAMFFDDLHIVHKRGALLEETHYYPFGLTMSGISSKAAGMVQSKKKFNGGNELQNGEFSDGSGLELYDAHFRQFDLQIGRFLQIDPLAGATFSFSPFVFGNNNPVRFNDPFGLTGNEPAKFGGDIPLTEKNGDLKEVTVTTTAKSRPINYINWPSSSPRERREWSDNQNTIYNRFRMGKPLSQKGDSYSYNVSLSNRKRWDAANREWKQNSLAVVLLIGSPTLLSAYAGAGFATAANSSVGFLRTTFTLQMQNNAGSGLADLVTQLVSNEFNVNKVNFSSVAANSMVGGNPLGAAITNSIIASTYNISIENISKVFSTGSISAIGPSSFNSWIGEVTFGTVGNLTGSVLGGQMVRDFGTTGGDFLSNLFGNSFGFALNGINQ